MNLIDRYVYAVVKNLPQKQRMDIENEIRTLIDDMLEQYQGNEPEETKLQKVLLDLGDPEQLADSYRESKRYLIGPQNFDNYLFVLKIVLGAVFIGLSVATMTGVFFTTDNSIISMITDYLATLFSGLIQAFAWVTVVFGISEYNGIKLMDKDDEGWNPAKLPVVPKKLAVIPKIETMFAIIFTTVFMSIFIFAPQVFAVYLQNESGSMTTIPVFNIARVSAYKIVLVVIFVLGILKEVSKLIAGRWSLKLAFSVVALDILSVVLTLSIFTNPKIWNPSFAAEVMKYADIEASAMPWINVPVGFVMVLILVYGIEIATTLYKGWKYN